MKKYVACLLILSFLLTAAGCGGQPAEPTDSVPAPSETVTEAPPSEETTPPQQQEPMISVSLPSVIEPVSADDGTKIFTYTYQTMALVAPEPEAVDAIILDFLNRVDSTRGTADSMAAQAKSDYHAGYTGWSPYVCRITYSPMRIDEQVLSLFGALINFSGGSHPIHAYPSVTYDMRTGEALTLPRILAIDDAGDKLCQYVIDALAPIKEEKYLDDAYAQAVRSRLTGDLSDETSWYFTATGICFYFAPYEIAPYSSGVITAEVPYSQLTGVIADEYLPQERGSSTGDVSAEVFDAAAQEQYTQFAEVTLEADSQKLLLHAQGTVHDVRLEVGSVSDSGDFTSSYTAFASKSLTTGDALVLEANVPEEARFRLSYVSGGETVYALLTMGADGTVQLTAV